MPKIIQLKNFAGHNNSVAHMLHSYRTKLQILIKTLKIKRGEFLQKTAGTNNYHMVTPSYMLAW